MGILKIWSWRQAIAKAKLEPSTKLVLYTLANYMNEHGQGCYPSLDTIQQETGLARATVCKHLDAAIEAGFLDKKIHGFNGQGWARNEYIAMYPITLEGSSTTEPPLEEGSSMSEQKAVQPLNSISPYNSASVVDVVNAVQIYDNLLSIFGGRYVYQPQSINKWLEAGASYELDIKPTAEAYLKVKGEPPRSLSWLDDKIAASIKIRQTPLTFKEKYGTPQQNYGQGYKPAKQSVTDATREAYEAALRGEL